MQIVSGIKPTLQQGWQATNQYTSGAQAQASDFYAKSRDYTSKTWSTYQPHVNRLSSDWKVRASDDAGHGLFCERASAAMYGYQLVEHVRLLKLQGLVAGQSMQQHRG